MEGEVSLPLFSPEIMVMNPSFRPAVPLLPPITLFHGTADFSIPYEARYCDVNWLPSESHFYSSWVRAWREFLSCTFFTVCWYGTLQCHFWRGITIGGCKGVYNFVPWQNTHRLILAGSYPETLFIDWFVCVGGEKFSHYANTARPSPTLLLLTSEWVLQYPALWITWEGSEELVVYHKGM